MISPLTTPVAYTPCHYTEHSAFLTDPDLNVTFDAILRMTDDAFLTWLDRVRGAILSQWDTQQVPPRVGLSETAIRDAWDRLIAASVADVWVRADDGSECLSVPAGSHSVISQWFPTMMKTRINYSETADGMSIYDMFANDAIWSRYRKSYATRHFRRDSFFAYSRAVHTHEAVPETSFVPTTARAYLEGLREQQRSREVDLFGTPVPYRSDVWLSPAAADESYDGYSGHIKNRSIWTVSQQDALAWKAEGIFPPHWFAAVDPSMKKPHYMLRLYDTSTRIFPDGFRSFRISMCQPAVNWPALGARALYERFTHGVRSPIVWDPSSGWAGRLVGALTSYTRPLYIGCDPNTDHVWVDDAGVRHSKYTEIAAFHDARLPFKTQPSPVLFFPCGSEEMRTQPAFQEYKGRVDVVFTSPPYFAKEVYSTDAEQSATKYPEFDRWCEDFLRPTLETAAEWLKPGGVLLWNIADAKFGGKLLPLEERSLHYIRQSGLVQKETIRLLLASMPGANRVTDDGTGTAKNTCKVNGRLVKYEPIFVWQKPYSTSS